MTGAGFYHCSVKGVGRAAGRSVVAAAAYRSGERLEDARTGEVFDYRARGGVEDTFILTRDGAAAWGDDRARLWNGAEAAEPRANGRLATELELALPHELTPVQRKQLVTDFLTPIIQKYGVAADVAMHEPGQEGDHRNHHAHCLLTHREFGPDGFGDIANTRSITRTRKGQEVQEQVAGIAATPADIRTIRKEWEHHVNLAYERAGLDIRVDHRSHEDRGIEQEPTKHLGPSATAMERREPGSSDRGDINRDIEERNAALRERAALEIAATKAQAELAAARQLAEMERAAEIERRAEQAMQEARRAAQGRVDDVRPASETAARATEPAAPIFDRDAANRAADEKIIDAAIQAEQAAHAAARGRKDDTRARSPEAEQDRPTARGPYTEFPAPEPPRPEPEAKAEPALGKTAGEIRTAWTLSRSAGEFEEALAARGLALAEVSADEARASQRTAAFAKEVGNFAPRWREGEIVAVNERGDVYRL
ncbi:MAG: MobA/MobL family protein, partial [Acetobacteraceae bacterium]|nr:MobA/MobL family protein [Acetobacteraceae bacterium]